MEQFFRELFDYNHHFNQKLGDVFDMNPENISETSVKLYSHLLNAHQIWNNRIDPQQTTFGVWEMHPSQDFRHIDRVNYDHSLLILGNSDLNGTIQYTNTKGQIFKNSIRDALFHIINHSTYHRGQIATEFRQTGLDPLVTDFIVYKR